MVSYASTCEPNVIDVYIPSELLQIGIWLIEG